MNSGEIEQIVVQRQKGLRRLLTGILLSFGSFLIQDSVPAASLHAAQALTAIPMMTGVVFTLTAIWQMRGIMRRLNADPQLLRIVNDERVTENMLKSTTIAVGLLILINSAAVVIPIVAPRLITAQALAECNWLVAVTASLGSFLYLDRAD